MLKKNVNIQDVKVFSAAILPAAAVIFTNVLVPFLQSVVHNSPSEQSQLMVPVLAQGTAYLVAPRPRNRR